ncbi:MAG TPA: helix-turn-helix transcriptional regulator [Pyrinomonadaceae bacterium]|nr:helix-turn-helix transcriptional regulator [Pyrinomonadaceae bacterium]
MARLSLERDSGNNTGRTEGDRRRGVAYRVVAPEEIIRRRYQRGLDSLAGISDSLRPHHPSFERVMQRVLANETLSHREAQVALCCIEGLTNAEIGTRLRVTEPTVKFHLRNVFLKFGVRRRAELISPLLL